MSDVPSSSVVWARRTLNELERCAGGPPSPALSSHRDLVDAMAAALPDPIAGMSFADALKIYAVLLAVRGWPDDLPDAVQILRLLQLLPRPRRAADLRVSLRAALDRS